MLAMSQAGRNAWRSQSRQRRFATTHWSIVVDLSVGGPARREIVAWSREVNLQPFEETISAVVLAVSLQLSVVSFWMNEANHGAPGLYFCHPRMEQLIRRRGQYLQVALVSG
jgi:hypothetical protein